LVEDITEIRGWTTVIVKGVLQISVMPSSKGFIHCKALPNVRHMAISLG
jgi:hypothetical protein